MLGQYGFLAKVFSYFEECKVSVDVVASSDVSLSLTLDNKQSQKGGTEELLVISQVAYFDILNNSFLFDRQNYEALLK